VTGKRRGGGASPLLSGHDACAVESSRMLGSQPDRPSLDVEGMMARRVARSVTRLALLAALTATLVAMQEAVRATAESMSSTSHGCPTTLPEPMARHQRPGTTKRMVPAAPETLLGCRYSSVPNSGVNGLTLQWSNLLPATGTARALNKMPAPIGAPSCPPSTTIYVLVFQYKGGGRLTVEAPSGGCNTATNGDRVGVMSPAFQERLLANLGSS
jgi:hypothetical protein